MSSSTPLNPYQANVPESSPSELHSSGPSIAIFPIWGVMLATFMATIFGGSVVIGLNLARARRTGAAIASVVLGLVAMIAIFGLAYLLPEETPGALFWGGQIALAYVAAKWADDKVRASLSNSIWTYASGWWGAAIGLIACIPVVGIILGAVLIEEALLPAEYKFKGDSVFYSAAATQADAHFLAEELGNDGWFNGTGATATISSSRGVYSIQLVVLADGWEDLETVAWATQFAERVADERFGRPLIIHLCDEHMHNHKTVEAR